MNRRSPGFLLVSQAGEGFLQYKTAEGLSPRTLSRYRDFLRIWLKHAGDVPLNQITTDSLRAFLIWLRTEYQPYRITGTERVLSNKTIRNIYMFLSSFYTWAGRELNLPNPLKGVPAPKFEQVPVEPFAKEEIEALLEACEFSRAASVPRWKVLAASLARCGLPT
jgi:integrase/recombinase XerD